MGDYDEAEVNLEYFLAEFPESRLYPEGEYQKGRLLYLQREFEAAIQVLYGFVNRYPKDPYLSNGFFWIGESLYSLGNFDEAETVYAHIVDSYPESFKIEAARYRLQLIQFKHRENELVKLLKISHEEYLRAVEEFLQREKAYEQALTEYQKRIAVVMSEDLQSEFDELNAELKEKQALIDRLQRENQQLASQVNTQAPAQERQPATRIAPTDTERVRELLEMKAAALELKEFYLGLIEKDGPGQ
jgi:tetratricopeptide (TPR) repeat protein